jgi:hypothetical protein
MRDAAEDRSFTPMIDAYDVSVEPAPASHPPNGHLDPREQLCKICGCARRSSRSCASRRPLASRRCATTHGSLRVLFPGSGDHLPSAGTTSFTAPFQPFWVMSKTIPSGVLYFTS